MLTTRTKTVEAKEQKTMILTLVVYQEDAIKSRSYNI